MSVNSNSQQVKHGFTLEMFPPSKILEIKKESLMSLSRMKN